jgi:hypothetical protein
MPPDSPHFDLSTVVLHNLVLEAHVLDVVLVHEAEDITGQIRSGYLNLRGDLKYVHLRLDSNDGFHVVVNGLSSQFVTTELLEIHNVDPSIILKDSQDNRLYYMTVTTTDHDNSSLLL